MNLQQAIRAAVLSIGRMADEDLVSLPEGLLVMAVLRQAITDALRGFPGGRLYLTASTQRPGSWDWWCSWLHIDSELAREKVLEYGAQYQKYRRAK